MKWREFANAIISEYDTIAYIDSDEEEFIFNEEFRYNDTYSI